MMTCPYPFVEKRVEVLSLPLLCFLLFQPFADREKLNVDLVRIERNKLDHPMYTHLIIVYIHHVQMTKTIRKLEKESNMWKTRWENTNHSLLQMVEEVCDYVVVFIYLLQLIETKLIILKIPFFGISGPCFIQLDPKEKFFSDKKSLAMYRYI